MISVFAFLRRSITSAESLSEGFMGREGAQAPSPRQGANLPERTPVDGRIVEVREDVRIANGDADAAAGVLEVAEEEIEAPGAGIEAEHAAAERAREEDRVATMAGMRRLHGVGVAAVE